MALFFPGHSKCPICDTVVGGADDYVATTHFIGDEADPLWAYSDAVMHRSCFLRWSHRRAFVAKYNATIGAITWGNGTYHDMQPDGTILSKRRGEG